MGKRTNQSEAEKIMPARNRSQKGRRANELKLLWVVTVPLSAGVAFFFGFEILERVWLAGVNPDVRRTLHLLQALSAGVIAVALACILLVRQMHRAEPVETLPPSETKSWRRRVQHVSLRTKIVVPMVVLAVTPALAIGIFTISSLRNSLRQQAQQRLAFETASRAQELRDFLQAVQRDLLFLSQLKVVRELVRAEAIGGSEQVAYLRRQAEEELLIFSQGKRAYYQVRYLNSRGREVVRLNAEGGLPQAVPFEELQDKGHRYYVKEALALEPGQIYVSEMDLNVEHGKIERPARGVLRYATPATGEGNEGRGLLVVNLFADYLFSLAGTLSPGTEAWWVDQEGVYVGYAGHSEEKRGLYDLAQGRRLSTDYTPEEVLTILEHPDPGPALETGEALVSFAPVALGAKASERKLVLMISHPRGPVDAPIRHLTIFLSIVVATVVAVSGGLGVLVAHYLAHPVAALRQATREIAGGHLSKRVEVGTGDEIEGLAIDFNAMTDRVQQAQERLAAWNKELKGEVSRRTEQLRQLQEGLARTDKLASIGQMTAAVMHEIGNPLAAMKTKIQVAEEEGVLSGQCRTLLSEVLREVNRLATFLRSFSRLGRLHEMRREEVSLAEVTTDVVAVIGPELQRRGVTLRTDAADAPTIQGDPDQLRQLLINLSLNAAEASQEGAEVLVRVRRLDPLPQNQGSSSATCIEVVDYGTGMPREIIDKIWDPFFTTKPEGTGLGLAICQKIVQDHRGTIQIQSEPGEGTTVTVTFPASTGKNERTA